MPRSPEVQRVVKRERYDAYTQLCRDHDIRPQWSNWWRHYNELQLTVGPFRRLTREEHYAFWMERFTPQEIREVGASLDFLSVEQVAA